MLRTVGVQLDDSIHRDSTVIIALNDTSITPSQGKDLLTSGITIHVTIRSTKRWFDLSITEGLEVETPKELATLALNDPVLDFGACPDPCMVYHREDM